MSAALPLLLVVVASSPRPADAGVASSEPETAANVVRRRVPAQRHPPLPGKAVGLYVVRRSRWGNAGYAVPVGAPRNYGDEFGFFFTEGHSSRLPVVPATDGPLQVRTPLPHKRAIPAAPLQLDAPAHLVRVTVNAGRGHAGPEAFIASEVQILDGTAEYPLKVEHAFDEARRRYEAYLAEQRPILERLFHAERRRVEEELFGERNKIALPGREPVQPPVSERLALERDVATEGFFPSWRSEGGQLSALFVYRAEQGVIRRYRGERGVRCPPTRRCPPPQDWFAARRSWAFQLAFAVTFARDGRVVLEEKFPPERVTD